MSSTAQILTRRSGFLATPEGHRAAGDVLAVFLMLLAAVQSFEVAFGGGEGYLAALGGVLLGLGVGIVSAVRGWTRAGTALAVLVTYLVAGGALALPSTTILGVVPTLETVQRLGLLLWQSWRDLLTVALPAGEFTGPAVVPFLSGLVCATLAACAALRLRHPQWALLPTTVFLLIGILWGAQRVPFAGLYGGLFVVTALGWLAWRSRTSRDTGPAIFRSPAALEAGSARRRAGVAAGVLTGAAVFAVLLAGLLGSTGRFVLRNEVVPPLDLQDYATPLTLFRDLEAKQEKEVVLEVDGLQKGQRIRLATMDVYDGNVFNVSESTASFAPVGRTILPGAYSDVEAEVDELRVRVASYDGPWVPGGTDLRGVSFDGSTAEEQQTGLFYNPATATALTTARVQEGSDYTVRLAAGPTPLDQQLPDDAVVDRQATGPVVEIEAVASALSDLVGDATTPLAQLRTLESELAKGFYSNGSKEASLAGHSAGRIQRLLDSPTGQMVGDDEQYAVAMALLARQLGYPSRVVMGFYPETPPAAAATVPIRGGDAHVWTEVPFRGVGWVAFDPTPPEDREPDQQRPDPQERNDPQVLPPPEVPDELELQPPAKAETERDDQQDEGIWALPAWVLYGLLSVLVLMLLASPFLLILLLKTRRRFTRRHAAVPSDRVSGAWAELTDLVADLGRRVPRHATRPESADLLAQRFSVGDLHTTAREIDSLVFAPQQPEDDEIARVWRRVDEHREALLDDLPSRQRWLSRFSLASFRGRPDRAVVWPSAATLLRRRPA